ncbi:MAG: cell division protein FtsQ/DivIB [Fimbriimonadaceae bacterium]
MRSKGRRKRRSSVRARPLLGWLLALNLAAGVACSPAMAARRVRVIGAKTVDQARMRGVLKGLEGVPYFLVNEPELESRLAAAPHLDSVSVSRNLFGRAVVRVVPRRPVARIASQRSLALDPQGVAFLHPGPVRGVPTVFLPGQAFRPWLSACAPFETRSLAWVCERASAIPSLDLGSVVLTYQGAVSLRDRSGATVVLGPAERLEEKLERLESILAERPSLFESVRVLNLTAPSRPAVVERSGVVQP